MNEDLLVANYMLGLCLSELVQMGFVSMEQVNGRWTSRCDLDELLARQGFAAAVTIDDKGMPLVIIESARCLYIEGLLQTIPHEAVHLAQICSGKYEPYAGYSIWMGVKYPNLLSTDPNYFSADHQPWEAEAKELAPQLERLLRSKIARDSLSV